MISIIDYGVGNLGSVLNMLKKVGGSAEIVSDLDKIGRAKKILLPGVGAFDTAMAKLTNSELRSILDRKALVEKIPVMGICLGAQLLTRGSEEGHLAGLGWIPASTLRFPTSELKVPHMGWNLTNRAAMSPLTNGFDEGFRFYFVHSYYIKTDRDENCILESTYGVRFASGIQKDNIFGFQFHPEKSHRYGMHLFRNFIKL